MKTSDPLLQKAERSLRAAQALLEGDNADFAASRTYYAYLYAAQALLLTKGLQFSRHGQVLAQFGRHFSKTRLIDPIYHRLLGRAFELRQIGDYQAGIVIDSEQVAELIEEGWKFLEAASRYLEEHPGDAEAGEGGDA
jgi:uncharacterized protein (UPF0332 family)